MDDDPRGRAGFFQQVFQWWVWGCHLPSNWHRFRLRRCAVSGDFLQYEMLNWPVGISPTKIWIPPSLMPDDSHGCLGCTTQKGFGESLTYKSDRWAIDLKSLNVCCTQMCHCLVVDQCQKHHFWACETMMVIMMKSNPWPGVCGGMWFLRGCTAQIYQQQWLSMLTRAPDLTCQ
jgi:hypothetical protein